MNQEYFKISRKDKNLDGQEKRDHDWSSEDRLEIL